MTTIKPQSKASKETNAASSVSFDPRILKIPDESSNDFHLVGSKCKSCGSIYFPQRLICPTCFRDDTLEETAFSKSGRLYSFSITRREFLAPPGFSLPYAFGYVDLPEGVRVVSLLKEWEPDLLRMDGEVELGIEPIGEDRAGNQVIGFYFRPKQGAVKVSQEKKETHRRGKNEEGSGTRSGDDRFREIPREDDRGIGCCS